MLTNKPTLIPIASGKGGVGKTFLTANLAIALASKGHPTIAVDLDLGGSNLHSFLGMSNKHPGIGDFLKARRGELNDLLVDTSIAGLKFLAGDGRTPFMANIPYAQKVRLLSRLRKLPAEYVLLDLGAGTTFNTLDFFNLSLNGLLVTTPENPSIFGMLAFLKNFMLRAVERRLARIHAVKNQMRDLYKQPLDGQQMTMAAVKAHLSQIEPEAGAYIDKLCRRFRPRIIFNHGENIAEMDIAAKIDQSLAAVLSIEADYFGFIFNDPAVRHAIQRHTPYMLYQPEGLTAGIVARIAERVVRFLNRPVKNSATLLARNTQELQQQFIT